MEMLRFRQATGADAPALASLNAQLIRDEGHQNPMAVAELAERMAVWLNDDYRAIIFESSEELVGYALFRREADHVYLRQLFVRPEHRRRGIGRLAVSWLWNNVWSDTSRVRIDVLIGNTGAAAFWRAVGFRDYCVTMEMEAPK
jgi:GNAT superfamily N-acetyltransferase